MPSGEHDTLNTLPPLSTVTCSRNPRSRFPTRISHERAKCKRSSKCSSNNMVQRRRRMDQQSETAAIVIQRHVRGFLIRHRLATQRRAATKIQRQLRRHLAQKWFRVLLPTSAKAREAEAALLKTQRQILHHEAELQLARGAGDVGVWENKRKGQAAVVIQAFFRRYLARKEVALRRAQRDKGAALAAAAERLRQESLNQQSTEPPMKDYDAILGEVLEYLQESRSNQRHQPQQGSSKLPESYELRPLSILESVAEVNEYIHYISSAVKGISEGCAVEIPAPASHKGGTANVNMRKAHLDSHKLANGRWWEVSQPFDWFAETGPNTKQNLVL
ncbi:hypothetical protein DFS34DRAFT_362534 [Phlyctochytrium arcticum]|nr:hypothetical protein DFS34DRAFT_362534 [Phlyctochytrium arcticum]